MKKILCPATLVLMLQIFFTACPEPGTDVTDNADTLENVVYAGPDAAGDWTTFAFVDRSRVYYFSDNIACYAWTYTYASGSGAITKPEGETSTQAAPGGFTLNDGNIVFTDYAGRGARTFKRVRNRDAVDETVPVTYTPLKAGDGLDGTVWAATGFRTKDWTTLTISSQNATSGTIQVSHCFDCTSNSRTYLGYAYNTATTLQYIGDFIVTGDAAGDTFIFQNFYGHGGKVTLKRMR